MDFLKIALFASYAVICLPRVTLAVLQRPIFCFGGGGYSLLAVDVACRGCPAWPLAQTRGQM